MKSIEWAAGLFEGEGTIRASKGRYDYSPRNLRLQLQSSDEDVVRAFHDVVKCGVVGGPYGPYGVSTKPVWSWTACGEAARPTLDAMLPFLGARRTARAEEVLELVLRRP